MVPSGRFDIELPARRSADPVGYGNRGGFRNWMDRLLEATHRAEQLHFWFRGFRSFVRPLIVRALEGRRAPRILDCGCGTGANLRMLGEYGEGYGFDITWRGLELARGYGPLRLVQASITDIPFASSLFDLVTAFDVLYALDDAQEEVAIREMYRIVKPGGWVIVNVAALNVLRGSHSVFGGEVRRSTRGRLHAILARAGFEIERLTFTNFSLFPLMLVVRVAQRAIGLPTPEEAGGDIAVPSAPVNAVLSSLLWLESRALRVVNMPVGSSLLCLARRPETRA